MKNIIIYSVPLEASGESESICHRSGAGNAADASEEGESLLSLACSAGYYELAQVFIGHLYIKKEIWILAFQNQNSSCQRDCNPPSWDLLSS